MNKKKKINENAETQVEENKTEVVAEDQASSNAASIQPKGKVDALAQAMTLLASMKGDEINNLLATLQQNSASAAASIPDGTAEKNRASVAAKGAVKEELELIFGGEELAEEFKEKISTLFEAAVTSRLQLEIAQLEEQFEITLEEQTDVIIEQLDEKIAKFLDAIADDWMDKNEVAIETSLRTEMTNEFINGLKNLFAEHYINVPDEQVDVLEAQQAEIDELNARLNESLNKTIELHSAVVESQKKEVFESVSEGLAMTQVEKFRQLAEGVDFDGDLDKYTRKLNIIKEKVFTVKKTVTESADVLNESFEGNVSSSGDEVTDPVMQAYLRTTSKIVKK